MGLKIMDEFLEDETILALKHPAYRLHVSALIYCAKNLTDGEVTDRGLKVLQVLLGYQLKRHVGELVEARLWTKKPGGGFQIRNFLEFNPSASTVKAERKKARERMRQLREKRALDGTVEPLTTDGSEERSPERAGERSPAVPDQALPVLEVQEVPGRKFPASHPDEREGLPFENELLVARLLARIGDHADIGTRHVVSSYARRLAPAALSKVIESIDENRPDDRAAYAVGALRDELGERAA